MKGSFFPGWLLIFLAFAPMKSPAAETSRPNILWLIAEDFGQHLGCYGTREVSSPNLDALAKTGVRYTRFFTTAPVCSPSRSAFMTGMYQTTIGSHNHRSHRDDGFPLPAGVRVLTDWFRDGGYFTANVRHMPQPIQWKGTAKTDWNFTYRTVLKRLRSVLEKWIEDSHDQGKELEPLDLVRRKGMTKAQTHSQSGYALDEKTLEPKNLTLPGKKP